MSTITRPRGVTVYPLPGGVSGPFDNYALMTRIGPDGLEVRVVHSEGVSYLVTDGKPWTWNDYDPTVKPWSPADLINVAGTVDGVDLSDWVRVHNARLESNFGLCHQWATA